MYQHHLKRRLARLSPVWNVESLEQRTLLHGVFDVSKIPQFVPTSASIRDVKHGPFAIAGAALAGLYAEYKAFAQDHNPAKQTFVSKTQPLMTYQRNSVSVTFRTRGSMAQASQLVHDLGGELIYRSGSMKSVAAYIPISQLSSLAQTSLVATLSPNFKPQTMSVGKVSNQADSGQNADSLRTTFGLDGSGMMVGVISDSFNVDGTGYDESIDSGDLPDDVQVVDEGSAGDTDEGRGMLELIHDIAPAAKLAFATSGSSQTEMAGNITALVNAGCDVIVDDIMFINDTFFQGGVIDQAITDAVENHNVVYLSSVGNSATGGYLMNTHWVKTENDRTLLDFNPTSDVDTRLRLTVNGNASVSFQWDEPYNGVSGAAKVDLDVNLIDPVSGAIIVQGIDANLDTTNPIELIFVPEGIYDLEVSVSDLAPDAALPNFFKFASGQIGGNLAPISNLEYPLSVSTTFGHNAGRDAISVAAVPFFGAPPYNNTQPIATEGFSSFGPVVSVFRQNGDQYSKPVVLLRPDISGIDGTDTTFFGDPDVVKNHDQNNYPNFFGTSAASPNVAGVAVLLRQLVPNATPGEIRRALIVSARKNPVNGQKPGQWNQAAGFGLIDGLAAAHELKSDVVVADIGRVVPDSVPRGIDSIPIDFSSPVTGFSLSDLSLRRNGSGTNLLAGANVTLTTDDHQHYLLGGLFNLTKLRGDYTLRLDPNGVVDSQNHPALAGSTSFFCSGMPTNFVVLPITPTEIDLSWDDNTTHETQFEVLRADNEAFTHNVLKILVTANQNYYQDTELTSAKQYFYRVHAVNTDGNPDPYTDIRSAFTLAPNEAVVDDHSTKGVTINGNWTTAIDAEDSYGGSYLRATPTANKSVTFTPNLDQAGRYFVYVHEVKLSTNATNAQVVLNNNGGKKSFTINQRTATDWTLLGRFDLSAGRNTSVTIGTANSSGVVVADGRVVADAVRFQRTSTSSATAVRVAGTTSLFSSTSVKDDNGDGVL